MPGIVVHTSVVPLPGNQGWRECSKFEVSLVYIVNCRHASSTWGEPVSQSEKLTGKYPVS